MRASVRETIRQSYNYHCGYCGVSETDLGAKMTIDHFLPRKYGGDDTVDNLVYSCHACNEFKGEYWGIEPDLILLLPRVEVIGEHFQVNEDGMLQAITDRGANHIKVLQLNRVELIAHRLEEREISEVRNRCRNLENYLAELEQIQVKNDSNIGLLFGDTDI